MLLISCVFKCHSFVVPNAMQLLICTLHRSMFHLRDDALVGTFGLAEQVKAAGITSVEMGLLTTVTNGRVSSWVPR